jgi:uncharacterized BrkB/YihY/UPF0761 family membrane protein
MAKQFREGSKRAKDEKAEKIFLGVAAVVYLFILLLFFFIPSYPKDWADRASAGANVLGVFLVLASYGVLYATANDMIGSKKRGGLSIGIIGIVLLLLALGCATLGGFNFDFRGIAERP